MSMDLDAATRARLLCLYPDFATRVIRVYADMQRLHGVTMRMTEGVRFFTHQAKLYQQGRRDPQSGQMVPGPIVTWAPYGYSRHHWAIAADGCFAGADPYLERLTKTDPAKAADLWASYGRLAQAHGCTWGGDWNGNGRTDDEKKKDQPHIEMRYGGLSDSDLLRIHARGGIRAVWAEFDHIRGLPSGHEWDFAPSIVRILEPDDIGS